MSDCSSASVAVSATVRTMKPPDSPSGIRECTFSRRFSRSATSSILCEMPMCGSCGR